MLFIIVLHKLSLFFIKFSYYLIVVQLQNKMEKDSPTDNSIEIFKMKRLFKRLETAKVTGSVVTIIIAPKKNVSDMTKLLI
jgi:hypothetical protein